MSALSAPPFLRVPPFPGVRVDSFARTPGEVARIDDGQVDQLIAQVKRLKVGGDYWGKQPGLPDRHYVLVRTAGEVDFETIASEKPIVRWTNEPFDPWHMLSGASDVVADGDDEILLLAAIAGVPFDCVGEGRFAALGQADAEASLRRLFVDAIGTSAFVDPYSDKILPVDEVIRLCGFWRELIDSNREISAAVGFGFWKRPTVAPLLWAGDDVQFASELPSEGAVAVWKSRTPPDVLNDLEKSRVRLLEVEDGFIRSAGLGADCVPPLSIVVDPIGIYFDPGQPSLLEQLIQSGPFTPELLQRARQLRELIVDSGVSKYGAGSSAALQRCSERTHILVPGQVEDDRSVQSGGGAVKSNFELLRRARRAAPEAYIIYKPHPDVEAGHRVGAIPDDECLSLADGIVRDQPIGALIELVDEVHVNTSLAGFEALLRSKPVTTHGVPFYAGWGLTRDFGNVPDRRTAKRDLDELVAAALLLYPRYLDPVSGLPCPPEVLVRRIAEGTRKPASAVSQLRRLQGRWKKFATRARGSR